LFPEHEPQEVAVPDTFGRNVAIDGTSSRRRGSRRATAGFSSSVVAFAHFALLHYFRFVLDGK
jgi:hypothetical protein